MGWINNAKADMALKEAQDAIEKGQTVLVYKLIEANMNHRATAPMPGIADQIQAIESLGWQLHNMAAAEGKAMTNDRTALICLFRRQPTPPPPPQQQVTWGTNQ